MPTPTLTASPGSPSAGAARRGHVHAAQVSQHAGRRQVLYDVSLSIKPGTLVAVAGGSGAGKTTLLEVLAGLRPPSSGAVTHDGITVAAGSVAGSGVGYVPQDDILHVELPLRRTLQYAARLRLPAGTGGREIDRVVDQTLADLDLHDRRDVPVRQLSGGQRKRASIAVELLTRPHVFFLDEPTSGLDPATAAEVMRVLRRLADRGVTVVLTTHEPASIDRCDHVVVLARDGHLAFTGTPAEARAYFEVEDLADIYTELSREDVPPPEWARRFTGVREPVGDTPSADPLSREPRAGALRQWWLLTRRNAEVLVRNRLTLAVLLGSPVLVTAMMATLFQRGSFGTGDVAGLGPVQIVFWIAFAGFFFGLTYGLLQIVGEQAVFRRERFAGVSVASYVASKISVLLPVLAGVSGLLLGVLRGLDRLPALGWEVYGMLFATVMIEAVSALGLGLLASAAVSNTAQAALALPMLCFPQVLFAGAIVPVADMAGAGRAVSTAMSNRHAFEALGRGLDLDGYGSQVTAAYGDTFGGPVTGSWLVLASFTVLFVLATVAVLRRRSRMRGRA